MEILKEFRQRIGRENIDTSGTKYSDFNKTIYNR